jgi:hypothetical protein
VLRPGMNKITFRASEGVLRSSTCRQTLQVRAPPVTHRFDHWGQRTSIRGERIVNAGWNRFLIVPFDDAIGDKFLKMANQHSLCDLWNGTLEFASAFGTIQQTPQNRTFPTAIHDSHHRIDGTLAHFLFRDWHFFLLN